uniref:AMP-dependent synthetase/ligase domain-containing protein n=1 Tax=Glossina pallidipes TaxID=7398 RepID=A0A1A9ZDT2_GLOPL
MLLETVEICSEGGLITILLGQVFVWESRLVWLVLMVMLRYLGVLGPVCFVLAPVAPVCIIYNAIASFGLIDPILEPRGSLSPDRNVFSGIFANNFSLLLLHCASVIAHIYPNVRTYCVHVVIILLINVAVGLGGRIADYHEGDNKMKDHEDGIFDNIEPHIESLIIIGRKQGRVDAVSGKEYTAKYMRDSAVRVAYVLKSLGIKANDVVGLSSENCFEFTITLFGAFAINATMAPFNITYLERERHHGINLSKHKVIFGSKRTTKRIVNIAENNAFVKKLSHLIAKTLRRIFCLLTN